MTLRHDRPITHRLVNRPITHRRVSGLPIAATGKVHIDPPAVDSAPPTRSKVTAALAALACAACCALPFLIAAGVLTGAGAALAQNLLLAGSGVLVAAAGGMWWQHPPHRPQGRRSRPLRMRRRQLCLLTGPPVRRS